MDIWGVIELLRSNNGKLFKEQALRDNDSPTLQRVVKMTMDPYIQFYLRKLPDYEPRIDNGIMTLDEALVSLEELSSRRLTGHAGRDHLKTILESVNARDALVIERVIGKDLKSGCSTGTADKVWPGLVASYDIQLAVPWNEKTFEKILKEDGYVWLEPKIDGLRVNVWIQDGTVTYYSRNGKEFETMDHITKGLLETYPNNVILDGEGKSESFQDSMSAITKSRGAEDKGITITLFDMVTIDEFNAGVATTRTYEERRAELLSYEAPEFIKYNPVDKVESLIEAKQIYMIHKEMGHEGTIVKRPKGTYDFKRNDNWMKIKPVETVDVEIIGYEHGNGRNANRLGNFIFAWGENKKGSVGTGISDKQRDEFWARRDEMIGEIIEIEFMELTDVTENGGGVPRHPVFIRERSFKGEKA